MAKTKNFLMILAMVLILPFAFMLTGCFGDENDDDNSEEKGSYRIVVEQPRGGNITVSKNSAQVGEEITLSHQADRGYYFVSYVVIGENERTISVNNNKFTMPASNVFVSARFAEGENPNPGQDDTEVETYTISVSQTTGGSISAYKSRAVEGEVVNLSFSENNGYSFNGFVVKDQNNNTIVVTNNSFTMPASNVTVSGTFTRISQNEYAIEIMDNHYGDITYSSNSSGREGVMGGARVTLSCDIYSGNMKFVRWQVKDSNNNDISVVDNSFIMPESNVTVNAVLEEKIYIFVIDESILDKCTIRVTDYDGNDITTADFSDYVYITCEVNPGYSFERWNVSDGQITLTTSTNKTENFSVNCGETITISAIINPKSYSIQTNSSNTTDFYLIDSEGSRTNVASTGDELSVVCTPNEGYEVKSLGYNMRRSNSSYGGVTIVASDAIDITTKKFVVPAVADATFIEIWAELGIIEKTLTITYLDNDEQTLITGLTPTTYKNTDEEFALPVPEKEGYRFDGWYQKSIYEEFYEQTRYIFPDVNSKDLTVIAKWIKLANITYHLGVMQDVEGYTITNNNPQTYGNDNAFNFANASQPGATFDGWYTTENFEEGTQITGVEASQEDAVDLDIYAKWTYKLYAIDDDYTILRRYMHVYDELTLGSVSKHGYDFDGWYTTSEFTEGTKISKIEKGQISNLAIHDNGSKVILYAKFDLITYNITYYLNGGMIATDANPSTYTTEDENITLANPTKSGCSFVGWYTDEDFDNKITTINKWSYGNKDLYALFNDNSSYFTYAGHKITGLTDAGKAQTNLVIPSEIDNYSITTLSEDCFFTSSFTTLTIPDSVVNIGPRAVGNNSNLTTVTFTGTPTTTSLGEYAFYACLELQTINLPDTIEVLGNSAFYNCYKLEISELPSALREIGNFAFYNCKKLTISELPQQVRKVGASAFKGCIAIENITLPRSMYYSDLGAEIFMNCTALQTATINFLTKIPESMFNGCANLETVTVTYYVEEIGKSAFKNCSAFTSITITNKSYLQKIGEEGFYNCANLELDLNFGHMKTFGKNAFYGCEKITTLEKTYMNEIETIGEGAFRGCVLIDFSLPSTVTSIGDYAFYGCTAQTDATIGSSVTYFGDYAFYGCISLPSATIGSNNITRIPTYAFYGCTSLESVTISSSNNIQTIKEYAFYGCSKLASLNFESLRNLTEIESYSFAESGIVNVNLVNSCITTFKSNTFLNCTSLERVSTNNSLSTIEAYTFSGCSNFVYFDTLSGLGSGDWDYEYRGPGVWISGAFFSVLNQDPSTQQSFAKAVSGEDAKCVYTRMHRSTE